jgi:hypothetical protein
MMQCPGNWSMSRLKASVHNNAVRQSYKRRVRVQKKRNQNRDKRIMERLDKLEQRQEEIITRLNKTWLERIKESLWLFQDKKQ